MQWSGYATDNGDRGLALRLLGPFSATVDGADIPSLRTYKGRWLLALLALRDGRPVERVWLATRLWPDSEDDKALYNLRRCLTDLRTALGEEAVRLESPAAHTLRLNLDGAFCDVLRFDEAVEGAGGSTASDLTRLAKAVELYSGPLLDGCDEEWAVQERAPRAEKFRRALETLATAAAGRGDRNGAIWHWRRLLTHEPLREEALRATLTLLAEAGDIAAALDTYRTHRQLVLNNFQVDLSRETKALYEDIQAGRIHATTPPPQTLTPTRVLPPTERPLPVPPLDTPDSGALPPDSPRYIERDTDSRFAQSVLRRDSIVLLKGARQTGKTSLMARGLRQARAAQYRVAITDFQRFSREQMTSSESLLRALAGHLADTLELDVAPGPESGWRPEASPNDNFERFVRRSILKRLDAPLVWALDEVDRLFNYAYRDDLFGMFRAWHNERALDPDAPWQRLTLVIAYATEAHLLVADLNQSPFNVGTRLELEDFTRTEAALLNDRFGGPLTVQEVERLHTLVGGHPYLTHRALSEVVRQGGDWPALEASAESPGGPFADHLRRLRRALERDDSLSDGVRSLLRGRGGAIPLETFHRLRAAGVVTGETPALARFRCPLYARFLDNAFAA